MKRERWGLLVMGLAACSAGVDPVATTEAPLFGDLDTFECYPDAWRSLLSDAHEAGEGIAVTPAFGACIQNRMTYSYKPCLDPEDPFVDESRWSQTNKALAVLRSTNMADVGVICDDLGDSRNGFAYYDEYGTDYELIYVNYHFLERVLANGVSDYELADVAGTIWHEAMHQHTYKHPDDDDDTCGYAPGEYSRGINSVPYLADRCTRSAGIQSRLVATNAAGVSQSFGVGRHRATAGDLDGVGDNQIVSVRLPPASRARLCTDVGLIGTGAGTCVAPVNDTLEYGALTPVAPGISYIEVQPRVLVFTGTDYGGNVQAFGAGVFRNDLGQLSGVGNDTIRSIYVPPGLRVRACEHEGLPAGLGSGRCATYEQPSSNLAGMANTISFLEVELAVTAFRNAGARGLHQTLGRGVHIGASGGLGAVGDNRMVAIVVPPGLTARLCTDFTLAGEGTGTCQTFDRTTFDLGASGLSSVSYVDVGPHPASSLVPVSVTMTGAGTVVSTPFGIRCGLGGSCSASFYRRGLVRLFANPAHADAHAVWTGCDGGTGNSCVVSPMAERDVSVTFEDDVLDMDCYRDCYATCRAGGGLPSFCHDDCARDCTL